MRKTNESGKEGTAFELSLGNYVIDNEVLHNIPTSSLNSIVERDRRVTFCLFLNSPNFRRGYTQKALFFGFYHFSIVFVFFSVIAFNNRNIISTSNFCMSYFTARGSRLFSEE